MQNDLFTGKEAMKLLRIRKSTLYSWVARGAIPYLKLTTSSSSSRGLLRFRRSDLEAWLKKRERGHRDENS